MKTLLLAIICLVCGVALGFVLNSLLFFGDVRWPGNYSEPTVVNNGVASSSNKPLSEDLFSPNSEQSASIQSNGVQPIKQALSEPEKQTSQSAGSALDQHTNSEPSAIAELSYENLGKFSTESSISDQQQLLALIARADLAQIAQVFSQIPDNNNRIHEQQWVIGLLAQRRVELDPQGVLQEIESLLLGSEGQYGDNMAMHLLAKRYALQHPQDMITWLSKLPENSVDSDSLMTMYFNLSEVAPESAMEMIMLNTSLASSASGGAESILYMWANKDPAGALQWLQNQDDPNLASEHAESLITMLVHSDPDAAKAAAQQFPDLVPESLLTSLEVVTLTETDPMAAYALAQSITDHEHSLSSKQSVLYTWSMSDPIAAIEFINTLPADNDRAMFGSIVGGSIGSGASRSVQKRNEILALSETLTPDLKMQVLEPLIMQWAVQEPQAAIDWWNSQPESSAKSGLLHSIAWNISGQQAMELYPLVDESAQVALSSAIIRDLYEREPTAAQNWYYELPNNAAKQNSLNELFMMTARHDPQQALFLLDDALANGTSNNGENADLVFRLLPMLAYEHSDMVENWLQSAELDDTAKGQLRDMFTGVQSQLNSFPISGPYGGYPTVMPEGAMYQRQIIND